MVPEDLNTMCVMLMTLATHDLHEKPQYLIYPSCIDLIFSYKSKFSLLKKYRIFNTDIPNLHALLRRVSWNDNSQAEITKTL